MVVARRTQEEEQQGWVLDIPAWLPSDTRESVVGSLLHQHTVFTLAEQLRAAGSASGASWAVGSQLSLLGLQRASNGRVYRPMPDVLVTRHALGERQTAIRVPVQGMPPLLIEVASPSTVRKDVGEKARVYLEAGVLEYLVFDPYKEHLKVEVWARRVVEVWEADERGWWWSEVCGVAFEPHGPLLRVRDAGGVLIKTSVELEQSLRAAEHARAEAEHARSAAERAGAEERQARLALEARLEVLERRLAMGDSLPPNES